MNIDNTKMIKGVAICMMVWFHTFMGPSYYIESAPEFNQVLISFNVVFKICVGMYAFMTGYGYFFAKNKNYNYSLQKITSLLKRYWVQLFTLFIPIALLGGYKLSFEKIIINLFGLLPNINWFAWYVFSIYLLCWCYLLFINGLTLNQCIIFYLQ